MFHVQRLEESPEVKFGQIVATQLEAQGLSQRKFAELLSDAGMAVDASAVSRMLRGQRSMRLSEVYLVAEALSVSVKSLLPDLPSKKEELVRLRNEQHRLWVDMAKRMVSFVDVNYDVVDLLSEEESLIDVVNSSSLGEPLRSASEYLRWTASRAEAGVIEMVKNDRLEALVDFAWVRDDAEKAEVLARIQDFLAPFILTSGQRIDKASSSEDDDGEHPEAS